MNIVEATKNALEQGIGITNKYLRNINCYLLPTNTDECYLIVPAGYSHKEDKKVAARWNPKAADILSNDWEVMEVKPWFL